MEIYYIPLIMYHIAEREVSKNQ